MLFVFMALSQAWAYTKRLLPFVVIILLYESFRSQADRLNAHVHYLFMPHLDKALFGNLPTVYLQNWLWHGYVQWYDVLLYIPYMLFFIVPLAIAILVWKTKDEYYWRVVSMFSVLFYAGYATFLIFPTAPPWLASQRGYIEHITRISSNVWASLGVRNFPSLYNHLAPNPVAAFPSLHSGVATLSALIIFKLYGRRWGALSLVYPLLIYIGVIYEGEHYATDVMAGIIYALGAYFAGPHVLNFVQTSWAKLIRSSNTKNALKSAK